MECKQSSKGSNDKGSQDFTRCSGSVVRSFNNYEGEQVLSFLEILSSIIELSFHNLGSGSQTISSPDREINNNSDKRIGRIYGKYNASSGVPKEPSDPTLISDIFNGIYSFPDWNYCKQNHEARSGILLSCNNKGTHQKLDFIKVNIGHASHSTVPSNSSANGVVHIGSFNNYGDGSQDFRKATIRCRGGSEKSFNNSGSGSQAMNSVKIICFGNNSGKPRSISSDKRNANDISFNAKGKGRQKFDGSDIPGR